MVLHTSGTCRGRGTKEFSADCIVAEKNFGGALVEANLRIEDRHIPIKMVSERYDLNARWDAGD
jgi:phage terminase large subunit-like protein